MSFEELNEEFGKSEREIASRGQLQSAPIGGYQLDQESQTLKQLKTLCPKLELKGVHLSYSGMRLGSDSDQILMIKVKFRPQIP